LTLATKSAQWDRAYSHRKILHESWVAYSSLLVA